uniref:Integrase catalytic domain-containing protein n=1 Tax=Tanacetum cinerariifolium TaxID=118510 RepID=A0A699I535_TANCI|nr:hypothetical protein [Tanacetum cinerariifolium]
MTGNISFLSDFKEFNGGYVAFGRNPKSGKISGKGKIKIGKLDFDDVYFFNELKFNLFSISQMCDKKNSVLLTDTECVVLSSDYKLPDENHVLLRVPRENNMYNVDLKNKGKQHRASCKFKPVSSVSHPLQRFSWVFFLATKDETSAVLKTFITGIENQINRKVKIIRCDNRTEFKNHDLNQFCGMKMIKKEFSVARTPQQNGVAERKNKTLIEAARTMLADSLLHIPFWAEAINTACYVKNKVLVNPLGKFDGKADEGFWVGYFVTSKAFRVFNSRTRIVQETLHINFLENKPNVAGIGPTWLFDIDTLIQSMNYQPVVSGSQPNHNEDPHNTDDDVVFGVQKNENEVHVSPSGIDKTKKHDDKAKRDDKGKSHVDPSKYPDDLDMPELEDIVYLDDEEDVAPQRRSMTRMVKEQGGLHQINDEDLYTYGCQSAFLYETLEEEVYVCQRPGFEDSDYPDKVYKVVKALYELHQDPRACMVRNVDNPSKFLMVGKGFFRVEALLFASMLVQPQATEKDEEVEVPTAPAPPSLTNSLSPPSQDPIPTPPQAQPATPSSPTQEQPTETSESSIPLLNTLLETSEEEGQEVREEEEVKVFRFPDVKKGSIDQDVSDATKDVSVAEPTVFDDEEVTMIMAQTLIKMKAEKAKILDEQIAQRLHDEEIKKAAAREKQEKDDLERAKVLQQQYDDKEENIDWNVVVEQIQEKYLDNIRKYQSLKKKQVFIAQARKNMIIYLKNMVGYKMKHFRGMTYDKVRPIFEREYKKVQTLFKPDKDVEEPTKKRVAEETLLQEIFKKLKAVEVKYPIIDWKIHSEGSRSYWKIIRGDGITEAYQGFKDMLKGFDKEDLVALVVGSRLMMLGKDDFAAEVTEEITLSS